MSDSAEGLAFQVQTRFGSSLLSCHETYGEVTAELEPMKLAQVALALRDEPAFKFEQLVDVCGVDYLDFGIADWQTSEGATSSGFSRAVGVGEYEDRTLDGPRFATVYHLLSHSNNQRLRLRAWLPDDPPRVPSMVEIWSSADWFEREAFDLFGILFDGHPDLRRILTDYGFVGHPFRKDFPLIGQVEMRYDIEKKRVVYEPVSIAPRTLVPKVIRHDHRYVDATPDAATEEPSDA